MSSSPAILAIDTAIGVSSVAVWREGKVAAYQQEETPTLQAAGLMPMVERCMGVANSRYADLTLVAVSVGPGSFTGIRIGLAAARGIAFALSIPCVGYTSLEILCYAAQQQGSQPVLAAVNAGKGEIFWHYSGVPLQDPQIGRLEGIRAKFPGALCVGPLFPEAPVAHPRADALAALAASIPERARPAHPLYIRPPDAKPNVLTPKACV